MSSVNTRARAAARKVADSGMHTDSANVSHAPATRILGPPRSPSPTTARDTDRVSHRSTRSAASFIARRKAIELKYAQEKARIQEDLLEKQREAALAEVDADESASQAVEEEPDQTIVQPADRVQDWLRDQGEPRALPPRDVNAPAPPLQATTRPAPRSPSPPGPNERRRDWLPKAMTRLAIQDEPRYQPMCPASGGWRARMIDLPSFDGSDPIEWLAFRAAYRQTNAMHMFSRIENMARLRIALKGRAKETVAAHLFTSEEPDLIMEDLDLRFNRPDLLLQREMTAIKTAPNNDIFEFAARVNNAVHSLTAIGEETYLHSPELLATVYAKLSPTLQRSWARHAFDNGRHRATLKEMAEFLRREAIMTRAAPGAVMIDTPKPTPPTIRRKGRQELHVHATTEACPLCNEPHTLIDCSQFAAMSVTDRWSHVKANRLCFRCLVSRHRRDDCRVKNCGVRKCRRPHHRLLHDVTREAPAPSPSPPGPSATVAAQVKVMEGTSQAAFSCNAVSIRKAYLKIIPVTIIGPTGETNVFAMLDEGSTVTIIAEATAREIGATGRPTPISLTTIGGTTTCTSEVVSFKIRGPNRVIHHITSRTVPDLDLVTQSITREDLQAYGHLRELADDLCYNNAHPSMIIGQDQWHLIIAREVRTGKISEPVATRTNLGWVIHGCAPARTKQTANLNLFAVAITDPLLEEVRRHFDLEAIGITPKTKPNPREERAMRVLEEHLTQDESGRYWAPLLWDSDHPVMPYNREQAANRLKTIKKKMESNPDYGAAYTRKMEEVIAKGYAEQREEDPTGWYLPHFGVTNPRKPEKLRIVYDAAARSHGVSLNDRLLEGPDLLQSLPGILYRFREGQIALTGDIREMFPQIKIKREHQRFQQFLWGGKEGVRKPDTFVMTSMIFGAASSPFTALYVKNKNAEKYAKEYPAAADAILNNHYMDDCIVSTDGVEEASRLARDITHIHRQAHFDIRDWACNNKEVLQTIPGDKQSGGKVQLTDGIEGAVKTLGLVWDTASDSLSFDVAINKVPIDVINGERTPTKREMLSALMSLFDPQGFAAPFTIQGRILLQKIWRSGIAWDDELRTAEAQIWRAWIAFLPQLADIRIPRWYGHRVDDCETELHVFVDASELAYCAVAYYVFIRGDEPPHTALIASKARVAPLKPTSIPRLELQAALLGARLANFICESHRRRVTTRHLWTDSKTVLSWIRSDARNYKPFVAHRISDITDLTDPSEWAWLPTKFNVADDATRDECRGLHNQHRWFLGPSFLRERDRPWMQPEDLQATTEEEKRRTVMATVDAEYAPSPHLPDPNRFSSYMRLERTAARVLQCRERWLQTIRPAKGGEHTTSLSQRHLEEARTLLLWEAQRLSFPRELRALRKNQPLPKDSPLSRLDVRLEEDDLIHLNGRIRRATVPVEYMNSPIVLHGSNQIVRLLITHYHTKYLHANNETVVNELRQRYYILRLRTTLRSVSARCQQCRVRRATPAIPPIGDLPTERLGSHLRAFTYCGLDYMGPVDVTVGRRREKRYIALFTCLTIRAVHLELVYSLTTDSAIMAVRRFISRRGCPTTLLTDNATCFRGAATELQNARASLDLRSLEEFAQTRGFEWKFLPPAAPSMGGAWERLVRSVKTALKATLTERAPRDEVLLTVMAEAENIINSRPLTHVPIDPDDPEAITPNHLLLGSSSGAPTPGVFDDGDIIRRRAWRAAQRLADMFWRRWSREYLPSLAPRPAPHSTSTDLRVGDLVYVVDPNAPRNVWIRGRVERVHPGEDGRVRVADVLTRGGQLRRPARKLAKICVDAEGQPPPAKKGCDEPAPRTVGADVGDGNVISGRM